VNPYSAATAFVRGDLEVPGDLIEAVRSYLEETPRDLAYRLLALVARWGPWKLAPKLLGGAGEASRLRHHYDLSNEFYRQFLDSRMVYSCAYFDRPGASLEDAQLAKLDLVCRKLELRPGERLLDIGCGWGALLVHAAEQYGAECVGCTLSGQQAAYARKQLHERGLGGRIEIRETDYHSLEGKFHKAASIGMFEHVGRRRLGAYFRRVRELIAPDGLFLNHGIVRPQFVRDSPETLFVQREVFPGGEIVHLSDVVAEAENAGFEVVDVENLRPHYALTCRTWVDRLTAKGEECLRYVDTRTWRTWLLYLAASAVNFECGYLEVHQVLLAPRGHSIHRRLTREHMLHGAGSKTVVNEASLESVSKRSESR